MSIDIQSITSQKTSNATSSSMTYVSDKHPSKMLESLNSLRKRQELYDVVILAGTLRLSAHRVVLAAASPYFEVCLMLSEVFKGVTIWCLN